VRTSGHRATAPRASASLRDQPANPRTAESRSAVRTKRALASAHADSQRKGRRRRVPPPGRRGWPFPALTRRRDQTRVCADGTWSQLLRTGAERAGGGVGRGVARATAHPQPRREPRSCRVPPRPPVHRRRQRRASPAPGLDGTGPSVPCVRGGSGCSRHDDARVARGRLMRLPSRGTSCGPGVRRVGPVPSRSTGSAPRLSRRLRRRTSLRSSVALTWTK
jgi:hypothetical protein